MDYAALSKQAQLTPAEIKAALPISFVMQEAGYPVVEIDPDGRLHCLCPFHQDSAPSFDIFGQRWGCYPCGIGGDVLDLLGRLAPQMSFGRQITWAERLIDRIPADWAAKAADEYIKREFDPRVALTRIEAAQSDDFVLRTIAEHYGWPDPAWLKDRWRVGSEWSQVLIPYYRRDGGLATFKRRGVGSVALAAPGGQLCLYGEWLDTDLDKPVLLCEGESDTWAADRALGGTHAVLGCPGASWIPRSLVDLAPLEGRQVIISFDGDEAGRKGTETWAAILREVEAVPEVWSLPAGQDIRSYLQG
jgi:CHC2 zinc finger/Toprim-like